MTTATLTLALAIGWSECSAPGEDVGAFQTAAPPGVKVGEALPEFEQTDDNGQPWKSTGHVGNKKILVLYFYPGDFTGGCTRQAQAYRDGLAKIEQLGAEVIGVSGDEVATHKLFKETYGLKHALLSDLKGELAQLLGVPVNAGGKVRATGPDRKPLLDANGQRIAVPLRDNLFATRVASTQFPVRMVAYNTRGRVVATQVFRYELGGPTLAPSAFRDLRPVLRARGPNGTTATVRMGHTIRGGLGQFKAKYLMTLALANAGRLTKYGA